MQKENKTPYCTATKGYFHIYYFPAKSSVQYKKIVCSASAAFYTNLQFTSCIKTVSSTTTRVATCAKNDVQRKEWNVFAETVQNIAISKNIGFLVSTQTR
jgi:hypothetical protein